jgi:hypothetical protein
MRLPSLRWRTGRSRVRDRFGRWAAACGPRQNDCGPLRSCPAQTLLLRGRLPGHSLPEACAPGLRIHSSPPLHAPLGPAAPQRAGARREGNRERECTDQPAASLTIGRCHTLSRSSGPYPSLSHSQVLRVRGAAASTPVFLLAQICDVGRSVSVRARRRDLINGVRRSARILPHPMRRIVADQATARRR